MNCESPSDFDVLGFVKRCGKNQGLNVVEKHLSGLQNSDTSDCTILRRRMLVKLSTLLTRVPAFSVLACICLLAFHFVFCEFNPLLGH